MKVLPPVLLVDGHADDRRLAGVVLEHEFGDLDLSDAGDAAAVAAALSQKKFGLAIVDPDLEFMAAADILRMVAEARPEAALVIFTHAVDESVVAEALRHGADGFVAKGSGGFLRLPTAVRAALFRARRRRLDAVRDAPYRRLVEGLPVGVFIATVDGEILEANPALAAILGFGSAEELTRRQLASFFSDRREGEAWRFRLDAASAVGNLETALRRRDGGSIWVRLSTWVVEDAASGVVHLHGTVEETATYHEAQEELVRRSAALTRSNSDLEQFAYVISHDLQQPLGVISRALDMVGGDDRAALSGEGRECLEHARKGADTLQRMVDAVLGYSRIDTRGGRFGVVDCGRVLDTVRAQLADDLDAVGAELTAEALPTVEGDEAQLAQLLHNLLSNSLKFRGAAKPRIHVGAEQRGEEWILSVGDNGIGVPPEAAERIFGMFQRLHTEAEIPGTGIGLAICRRIAARHGGRIWVESRPGEGATFKVALPRRPAERPDQSGGGE